MFNLKIHVKATSSDGLGFFGGFSGMLLLIEKLIVFFVSVPGDKKKEITLSWNKKLQLKLE